MTLSQRSDATSTTYAVDGPDEETDRWKWARRAGLGGYLVVFVTYCLARGIPFDKVLVIPWVAGGMAAASIGRSWRQVLQLVLDWAPFAAVLVVYDLSRGIANEINPTVHYLPQLEVDRWLFFGHVPTVWLQDRWVGGGPYWYDAVFDLTYVSHFLVSFVLAAVLWVRSRPRFLRYAKRFVALNFAAVATFVAFPSAPPWMAARLGLIDPVRRTIGAGFDEILHLEPVRAVIVHGRVATNPVAAVPSLHAGYAVLVALVLWPRAPRWAKPLLVAYPLLMSLTLVATGEHYVSDLIAGALFAVAVDRAFAWWERRSASGCAAGQPHSLAGQTSASELDGYGARAQRAGAQPPGD